MKVRYLRAGDELLDKDSAFLLPAELCLDSLGIEVAAEIVMHDLGVQWRFIYES